MLFVGLDLARGKVYVGADGNLFGQYDKGAHLADRGHLASFGGSISILN